LRGCFHTDGAGRPPRSPLGLFRTFIVMRMKGVRSLREMARLLDTDLRLRKLCLIKTGEAGYPRSVLSRFIRKVGEDNLTRIIEEKVVKLLKQNDAKDVDTVFDASFIKAWSTRDPLDNQKGYSDMEARVGRTGRTFGLGYKLHLSIDSQTMLPLTCTLASANQNEKKHSLDLFEKASVHLKPKRLVADPQYSSQNLRDVALKQGTVPVIPYPRNQQKGVKCILRIDRKFKSHGPQELRRAYRKRVAVERVFSRLKNLAGLTQHNLRGLAKITFHAQLCLLIMLFTAQAAINTHKPSKARSIRHFAN